LRARTTVLIGSLTGLLVALTLAAGCSGSDDAAVAAVSSSAAAASSLAASSAAAASSSAAAASSAAVAASQAAAAKAAVEASRSAAAAASQEAERSRSQSAASADTDTDGAAKAAAQVAAEAAAQQAAGGEPADPDAPGDDAGEPCPSDPQYHDDQPTGLRADVAAAWQSAVATAATVGVQLCLNDGKRSRAQQQATYDDYVKQFGTAMANDYVLPPDTSAHVLGYAIDVQPYAAYTWLQGTSGALGFCRTYDNEVWHFEYDPAFMTGGCPARTAHPGG
jgi:D-alanyl-D-alanine carboxypeptidase